MLIATGFVTAIAGTLTTTQGHLLRSGKTKSCGCLQRENLKLGIEKFAVWNRRGSKTGYTAPSKSGGIHCSPGAIQFKKQQYEKQKGLCGLCGQPLPEFRKSYFDHNHVTGELRALVHPLCNHIIAHVENSPELVEEAKIYLENYRGTQN